jgi:hypothetical protein
MQAGQCWGQVGIRVETAGTVEQITIVRQQKMSSTNSTALMSTGVLTFLTITQQSVMT